MRKGVFWIDSAIVMPNGRLIAYPFETDAETVEELTNKLAERGIVGGHQLFVVDDGRGGKLVQRRKPIALTVKGIARISPYDFRVWEPEDAPA